MIYICCNIVESNEQSLSKSIDYQSYGISDILVLVLVIWGVLDICEVLICGDDIDVDMFVYFFNIYFY